LRFDHTFTAKAVMGGVTLSQGTFKRADDGKYYLHDGNQFLLTDGKTAIVVLRFVVPW